MLDTFNYHMTSKLIKIYFFCVCENVTILPSFMQCYNVHHYLTSGLSILLHGVISLPDATSCDKWHSNALVFVTQRLIG